MRKINHSKSLEGKLRIIGGKWRGRKISVTPNSDVRPTKDFVRETLFNWIHPHLQDANCLDLFCGTGALGLEALSRGASYCDFVDSCKSTTKTLTLTLEGWNANDLAAIHSVQASRFLSAKNKRNYDIIFMDPPFNSGMLDDAFKAIARGNILLPGSLIYAEFLASQPHNEIPSTTQTRNEAVFCANIQRT